MGNARHEESPMVFEEKQAVLLRDEAGAGAVERVDDETPPECVQS